MAEESSKRGLRDVVRKRWRAWVRAIHRDVGYLAVGFTVIYAVSGIAINHRGDWDPDQSTVRNERTVSVPLPTDEQEAAGQVATAFAISQTPRDFFADEDKGTFEVFFEGRDDHKVVVKVASGTAVETYKDDRFLLKVWNWLHLNRGKKAWTYLADGYALLLLYLAFSGLFMLRGRKGLIGRGGILVIAGIAVPVLYLHFAGGPGG